ncbi:MAG: hypothetical protein QM535_16620 [Limnohabitans sp.]|nr:hypothetical protein [Limnohabitans sp.]
MEKRKLRAFFVGVFILNFTNIFCQEINPKTEKKSDQVEEQIKTNEKMNSNQRILLKYDISRFNSTAIIRKKLYC